MRKIFFISAFLFLFSAAHAQDWSYKAYLEPREQRSGVLCDRKEQAQTYSRFVGNGTDLNIAIEIVNHAAGEIACVLKNVAFERAGSSEMISIPGGIFQIAEIRVYGFFNATARGWVIFKRPRTQFIVLFSYVAQV